MKVVLRAVLSVLLGANLISECFGADEPFACRSLDSKTVCQLPEGTVEVSGATTNITLDQGTNVWVGAGPQATTLMFLNNLTLPGSVVLQLVNLTLKGPHIGGACLGSGVAFMSSASNVKSTASLGLNTWPIAPVLSGPPNRLIDNPWAPGEHVVSGDAICSAVLHATAPAHQQC
jgi:hypothetical protein